MPCANSTTSASPRPISIAVGLPAEEWALVGLNGNDIYSEPRGRLAGYAGRNMRCIAASFHMLLHDKAVERIGPDGPSGSAAG